MIKDRDYERLLDDRMDRVRGIRVINADFRIPAGALRIVLDDDEDSISIPDVVPELRFDLPTTGSSSARPPPSATYRVVGCPP